MPPEPRALARGTAPQGSGFAPLLREVRRQGLLERRRGWYTRMITVNVLALAAVVTAIALAGNTWWSLPPAPRLAVLSASTAFVGHDAGHAQTAAGRRANRALGLLPEVADHPAT